MKTFETGLAKRMRDWMSNKRRAFYPYQVCDGLVIPKGPERNKVRSAIHDFLERGEIHSAGNGKFRYNHTWLQLRTGKKTQLRAKILKAIHVSISRFSVFDLQRLSEASNRNYIHRIIRELIAKGYIRKVGWRPAAGGTGNERVYAVINRDRFRIEVME